MTDALRRLRRYRITLRFTADERRALVASAARTGLCLSAFIRLAILRARPPRAARRPPVEVALLAALLARLGEIASALHQITNSLALRELTVMPSVERELLATLRNLREASRDLLRALGRKAVRL